ncbi:MAG: glutamate--tRNA ligase [Candidatus Omnitrophota bacterium]
MQGKTKVRFAPSPTGFLHIGSARTALFNWLFSKKYKAAFLLRIEDTDTKRSRQEFLDEILESLTWLGLFWDETCRQSERLNLYRQYADKLVDEEKAYKEDGAVIFPYEYEKIIFNDSIRGDIEFNELPKDSEVLIKSDGTPTYNFACCVDDALLGITHVIRGDDHIANTPKQILILKALGFAPPQFAHLPMILSQEGGKLSKRFAATAIRDYRNQGYLAKAVANYLLLLGWSPGDDREIISLKEACEIFEIKNVSKTAAAFSLQRLEWINSEYIKREPLDTICEEVEIYAKKNGLCDEGIEKEYLRKVVELFKTRTPKLSDFFMRSQAYFSDQFIYDDDTKDVLQRDLSKDIALLKEELAGLDPFVHDIIEGAFRRFAEGAGLKARDLVHPVRVALTGKKVGPGLFETMEVLGKERVVQRLGRLLDYWQAESRGR